MGRGNRVTIDASTPVVVLRCARHGGLGITRSLGRLGVPVFNVDAGRWVPAFVSRYSAGRFQWDIESAPERESLRFLEDVAGKIGKRPILIPTSDNIAMFVADHAERLAQSFSFARPGAQMVRTLCSKKEMYFLAKRLGIPTAETAFPQNRADVLRHLETARFPIMLKGILGSKLDSRSGKRMFLVHDRKQLLQHYDACENPDAPNIMLQEYIPGGDDTVWMFNGYFDSNSDCSVAFTGKKIRQYPVYTGLTSLGICLKNETVERRTREFMKAVGYRGILDIGYRYDARDNEYKVLDINPRVGATFRLFVGANGMDVIRALYLDLTGQPAQTANTQEGRKWLVEDCDLISCYRYFRDGKLTFGEWVKSHRGVAETGIFAADDPLPALWMGFRDLDIFIRRALRLGESGGLM